MSHPLRALLAIIATTLALAGTAEARTHHRHHPLPAAATKRVCHRHHCHTVKVAAAPTLRRICRHHHCHTVKVVAAAPTSHRVCRHHHCHTVTVAAAPTSHRVCHHHHCHTVKVAAASTHVRHPLVAPQPGDNGTCKSVRLHGQWVQRCNFPNQ